jgi:cell division protein FtsL
MSNITVEKAWKVFTVVLGVVIVPLAGWVWSTNVDIVQLNNDLGDAEETIHSLQITIQAADNNSKAIISIEKDIEYMKETLGRIERLVAD